MNDNEDVETVPITEVLLIDENGVIVNQQAFGTKHSSPETDDDYDDLIKDEVIDDFEDEEEEEEEEYDEDEGLHDTYVDDDIIDDSDQYELLNGVAVKKIKIDCGAVEKIETVDEDMRLLFTSTCYRRKEKVTCPVCSVVFTGTGSLMNHLKYKHAPRIEQPLSCEKCGRTFKYPSKYKRHAERKDCTERVQSFACLLCEFVTDTTELIMNHYSNSHGLDMTKTMVNFATEAEFDAWREKFCVQNKTNFAIQSGSRPNRQGTRIVVYRCHRDGFYRPKGLNKRRIKSLGSNKMNGRCPAHIHARVSKNGVEAYYVNTHVGHGTEVARLRLNKTERAMVAEKLAAKVPMKDILDSVRDSVNGETVSRIHLLSRVDLHNLCRSYGLSKDSFKASKVKMNISKWVEQQAQGNIVRFYKPKGVVLKEFPLLSIDDFYLVLMSESQVTAMSQYASNCVCVDGLSGYSHEEYCLYTVMVLQKNMKCIPCAFMFTNKEDEMALELMFDRVKAAIGGKSVEPTHFFSDVDDIYYSAWCSAMSPPKTRLFLPWCVDNDWRDNLTTIADQEKLVEVYRKLKTLMEDREVSEFEIHMTELNNDLLSDKDTEAFGRYFEAKYAEEPAAWAQCYAAASGISTTAHLENAHRVLSHIYTKGRQAKRLDKTVSALLKFAKERLVEERPRRGRGAKGKAARHAAGAAIGVSRIYDDSDGSWAIIGQGREGNHTVRTLSEECNCHDRCEDCNACAHTMACTCADHAQGHMCKHAHAICLMLKDTGEQEYQLILDADNSEPEIFIEYVSVDDGDEIIMDGDGAQVFSSIDVKDEEDKSDNGITHVVIDETCNSSIKDQENVKIEPQEMDEYDGVETDGHMIQIEEPDEDWPSLRADLKAFSDDIIASISDVDSYQIFRDTLIRLRDHICK